MCDTAEVYVVDNRRARKDHRCAECLGIIQPGEIYRFHHGIFDGSGFGYKICVDCDTLRDELNKQRYSYDQICTGELCDAVFEDDEAVIKRFMEIMLKRGVQPQPWMTQRLA